MDAIAPHLEHITGTVGARAIGEFGIDVSRLHWDMTSMSVQGAYPAEGQDEDAARRNSPAAKATYAAPAKSMPGIASMDR